MLILGYVKCEGIIDGMNAFIPQLTSTIVTLIKLGVQIIIVILGMIDLFKAMTAQKEDEIKKAQTLFFKRLIAGVLVFLVFIIVEFVFNMLGAAVGNNKTNIWKCASCFIEGPTKDGGTSIDDAIECR